MRFNLPRLRDLEIPYTSLIRGQVTLLIEYDESDDIVYGIVVEAPRTNVSSPNDHGQDTVVLPSLVALDFLQAEGLLDSRHDSTLALSRIIYQHLGDLTEESRHPT